MIPVEVMASGRPVIAYGRRVTESVTAGVSGLFFEEQTAAAIERAIHDFERMSFDSRAIRAQAEKFNTHKFLTDSLPPSRARSATSSICQFYQTPR